MPQDLPDGQYNHLEKSGKKAKANPLRELGAGLTNYRMYGLAACYAYSFGVEVRSVPSGALGSAVSLGCARVIKARLPAMPPTQGYCLGFAPKHYAC